VKHKETAMMLKLSNYHLRGIGNRDHIYLQQFDLEDKDPHHNIAVSHIHVAIIKPRKNKHKQNL
jgi:hypothetical protein